MPSPIYSPSDAPSIVFAYKIGDRIEQLDHGRPRQWRPAFVVSLAPYRGAAGYYTKWTIDAGSSGGWTYEANMRRPSVVLPLLDAMLSERTK